MIEKEPTTADSIETMAMSTRPIACIRLKELFEEFLRIKKQIGSDLEKRLYQYCDVKDLVHRLLTKRPLTFYTPKDTYRLRDGKTNGEGGFEQIGTLVDDGRSKLTLSEYISYDEMLLSACIGVSVPTLFINDGKRNNLGKPADKKSYCPQGVYIGLVGARFEKEGLMEWKLCVVTQTQNTAENGYGRRDANTQLAAGNGELIRAWAKFLRQGDSKSQNWYLPTWDEAKAAIKVDASQENYVRSHQPCPPCHETYFFMV